MWRTAYGLGLIPIMYMLYYRIFRLRESAVWKKRGADQPRHLGLLFKHYWPRLLATAGAWFLWDFSFYGNKVFQSAFIKVLSPAGAGMLFTMQALVHGWHSTSILGALSLVLQLSCSFAPVFHICATCSEIVICLNGIAQLCSAKLSHTYVISLLRMSRWSSICCSLALHPEVLLGLLNYCDILQIWRRRCCGLC